MGFCTWLFVSQVEEPPEETGGSRNGFQIIYFAGVKGDLLSFVKLVACLGLLSTEF